MQLRGKLKNASNIHPPVTVRRVSGFELFRFHVTKGEYCRCKATTPDGWVLKGNPQETIAEENTMLRTWKWGRPSGAVVPQQSIASRRLYSSGKHGKLQKDRSFTGSVTGKKQRRRHINLPERPARPEGCKQGLGMNGGSLYRAYIWHEYRSTSRGWWNVVAPNPVCGQLKCKLYTSYQTTIGYVEHMSTELTAPSTFREEDSLWLEKPTWCLGNIPWLLLSHPRCHSLHHSVLVPDHPCLVLTWVAHGCHVGITWDIHVREKRGGSSILG